MILISCASVCNKSQMILFETLSTQLICIGTYRGVHVTQLLPLDLLYNIIIYNITKANRAL